MGQTNNNFGAMLQVSIFAKQKCEMHSRLNFPSVFLQYSNVWWTWSHDYFVSIDDNDDDDDGRYEFGIVL